MASDTLNQCPSKKLGQLLQEKQEPFKLNVYLLERGYSRKEANRHEEFFKSSVNKRKRIVPKFSKIVKAFVYKLVPAKNLEKDNGQGNNAEEERFSSASSTTVFNSCSESDNDSSQKRQIAADRREYRQKCTEDHQQQQQQLSPVSVLEETHSDQNSPIYNVRQGVSGKKEEISTDSSVAATAKKAHTIFSVPISMLLENQSTEIFLEYNNIKSQLGETQHLLFDFNCMKELVETYKLKNKRQHQQQQQQHYFGAKDTGNVLEWSEKSQLIDFGPQASLEEWNDSFQEQKEEIAMVMEDCILDDIINEFVTL